MALSDWTQYVNQNWSFLINVTTPIVSSGTGRLAFAPANSGSSYSNIVVTALSGRTKGVVKGKLRTLFRYDVPPSAGTQNTFGLVFMMGNENINSASNNYRVQYNFTTGRIELIKSIGAGPAGGSLLAQGPLFTPGNNVTFSLEVEWIKDITELGGVAIFVKSGLATDYSDLGSVVTYLDATSPLLISVAESIFTLSGYPTPTGAGWNLDFDQTTMFIP